MAVPFNCSPKGFRVSVPPGNINSQLMSINLVTGLGTVINPDIGLPLNAIGYNPVNNLIYGIEQGGSTNLVELDATGTSVIIGPVTNLPPIPPSGNYNVGAIDTNQMLYIKGGIDATYYTINVNPSSPNFGKLVGLSTLFQTIFLRVFFRNSTGVI